MDCNLSLTECMDLLQFIKQSCRGNGRVKRQISIKFDSVDRFYPVDSDQRDSQSTLSLHTSYFIHDSERRHTRNAMAIKSDKNEWTVLILRQYHFARDITVDRSTKTIKLSC